MTVTVKPDGRYRQNGASAILVARRRAVAALGVSRPEIEATPCQPAGGRLEVAIVLGRSSPLR
jgi:hypothetical protein